MLQLQNQNWSQLNDFEVRILLLPSIYFFFYFFLCLYKQVCLIQRMNKNNLRYNLDYRFLHCVEQNIINTIGICGWSLPNTYFYFHNFYIQGQISLKQCNNLLVNEIWMFILFGNILFLWYEKSIRQLKKMMSWHNYTP